MGLLNVLAAAKHGLVVPLLTSQQDAKAVASDVAHCSDVPNLSRAGHREAAIVRTGAVDFSVNDASAIQVNDWAIIRTLPLGTELAVFGVLCDRAIIHGVEVVPADPDALIGRRPGGFHSDVFAVPKATRLAFTALDCRLTRRTLGDSVRGFLVGATTWL